MHARLIAYDARLLDRAVHASPFDALHAQPDPPVVDEDHVADPDVLGEALVLDRNHVLLGIGRSPLDQRDFTARRYDVGAPRKRSGADLRTAEVLKRGHRFLALVGGGAERRQTSCMILRVSVGEIEPRNIHSRQDELLEGLPGLTCGADRADDFGPPGEHR